MLEVKYFVPRTIDEPVTTILNNVTRLDIAWCKRIEYSTEEEHNQLINDIINAYKRQHGNICRRIMNR